MNRRWYPTCTSLGDGRVLISDGFDPAFYLPFYNPPFTRANIPVILTPPTPSSSNWTFSPLYDAQYYDHPNPAPYQWFLYNYPFMFETTQDVVFAGSALMNPANGNEMRSRKLNVELETWTDVPAVPNPQTPTMPIKGGSAVLYAADTILKAGGGTTDNQTNSFHCAVSTISNKAYRIRVSDAVPEWTEMAPMNHARMNFYMVATPDGKVLAVGGTRGGPTETEMCNTANSILTPEVYDPVANTWTVMNPMQWPRLYHSSAVLLWDGSV